MREQAQATCDAGVPELSARAAFVFRITHINNLPHILDHGACCRNSPNHNPNYINIGNTDLIGRRSRRAVLRPPGGTLSDYVPFYFTPHSPMLGNIHQGRNGVTRRDNEEIVFLLTSHRHLVKHETAFVFTDRHAYTPGTKFFTTMEDLKYIDWQSIRARDFKRDMNDPLKFERYQAETLVHSVVPVNALAAIGCFNERARAHVQTLVDERNLRLQVVRRPGWYFP